MDRNQLTLVGHVGDRVKFDRGTNGKEYIYFPLLVNARSTAKEYGYNHQQIIHVMCFKSNVLEYLKKVGIKSNSHVILFGFISSYMSEIKGKQLIENGVLANEVYIIKTKGEE